MRTYALLLALMVGCGGDPGGPDARVDARVARDGGPDVDPYCHWDCFGGYACEGGVVLRYAATPVPCPAWTGRCPSYPEPVSPCMEGCREGAFGTTAEMVCEENQPHAPGDPCATDGDCQPPGMELDGFGGSRTITLVCGASGTCERVPYEDCNGVDDDGDGATDEDCFASPGPIVCAPLLGPPGWAVVGTDRIGLLTGYSGEEALTLVDPSGEATGTFVEPDLRQVTTNGHDIVAVRYVAYATTAELVVLGPDAAVRVRVILRDVIPERSIRVLPFGDEWLVYDGGRISRHTASGARIDFATLEVYPSLSVAPIDGGLLLVESYLGAFTPKILRVPLEVVDPPYVPGELRQATRLIALGTTILGTGASDYDGTFLIRYDAATGLELERLRIGHLTTLDPPAFTRAGDAVAYSYRDGDVLRTRLFDASGTEVGRTLLDVVGVEHGAPYAGEMAVGPRIVSVGETTFCILAPAER